MNDQAASLRRKLQIAKDPRTAKTISIVSGKGGVGKTNFAVNFSLELIDKGKKVLLIDLDVGMGNIDILLGLYAKKTIIDMLDNRLSIHDIIEIGPNNLSYIAGGSGLTNFFTMSPEKLEYFFEQYNELVEIYDYILFDMGAGATSESILFILASDECIVITTPEPTSITDGYSMIKHIINNQQNMPIYVVMNRSLSDKSGKQSLVRFEKVVSQFLHVNVHLMGVLPEDKVVNTAVMRQTPYVLLNRRSAISRAIRQLVDSYLSDRKELDNAKPFSFIEKLKQLVRER